MFKLLKTGLEIPSIGLGTNQLIGQHLEHALTTALNAGYRLIDTSPAFANQQLVGRVVGDQLRSGAVDRRNLFIVNRLPLTVGSADRSDRVDFRLLFDESMRNLDVSYVDALIVDWPLEFQTNSERSIGLVDFSHFEQIWIMMEKAVDEGLVRNLGVSSFTFSKIDQLRVRCRHPVSIYAGECHLFCSSFKNIQNYLKKRFIHYLAQSPLGCPGRVRLVNNCKESILLENETVGKVAEKYGRSPAQICLRFLTQTGRTVVPKSSSSEHLLENLKSSEFNLEKEDLKTLENLSKINIRYFRQLKRFQ